MFEVGFTELLLISVIALIVLGPERLPKLVGQVGRWVGKARSMARSFREQLESEVNLEEMTRTPPRPAQTTYPPPGEAPPNEPGLSDSLATAHTTAAEEAAAQAAADTAHHPTADYPYSEPSAYHPEGDVYAGTAVPQPEHVTPEESESVAIAPASGDEPVKDPDGPHGHRV